MGIVSVSNNFNGAPMMNGMTAYTNSGDNLNGWTNNGASINTSEGQPPPSIYVPPGDYVYKEFPTISFDNCVITYDVYIIAAAASLIDFFFGCNASGAGNMFRVDCRGSGNYSGFAQTSSWTLWDAPGSSPFTTVPPTNTWLSVEIHITNSYANVLYQGTQVLSNVYLSNVGNYIGLVGDSSATSGGYFQNLYFS